MQKSLIFISGVLIIILVSLFLLKSNFTGNILSQNLKTSHPAASNPQPLELNPTPTPIPFAELTIPYLRERSYQSSLGDLKKISENGSYTSYLTSYSSDGLKINSLLTKPTGIVPDRGWPAIVFVHGYIPPQTYQTTQGYVSYVDYLASQGFVVFKIDLRGHGDSGGEAGGGYYSSDYVIDTLNAYEALKSTDFVNPSQIGLWGHSMAGNIISRSIAVKPEIPAAVIWAGAGFTYTDLNQFGISDSSYRPQPQDTKRQKKRQEMRDIYGDPRDGNPFWKLVAPTDYLKDYMGAIQLNHAIDDAVVNIEYSRNLDSLLDQTTIPHELHEYPSGGHNITGNNFSEAIQNTAEFYKKYLNK